MPESKRTGEGNKRPHKLLKKFEVYFLRERERERERRERTSGEGAERDGDTESKAGSRL